MKKFIALLLLIALVLPCLMACSDTKVLSQQMYVSHVDSKGFAGQIDGLGSVYILYPKASDSIQVNDFISINYRSDKISQEKGFINFGSNQTFNYEWIIEKIETVNVRGH
ncbi:MAG: hypothetical protein IJV82_05365 [Oscillospiraceae bacterium]|nr:hypothetical protein [Oscillospiraceae bacterium]